MIDLDRFKQINDTYGHAAGDGFLQAVAAVLTADVRECDVVARIGGDEFTVLMTDLDGGNCAARAQALSNRLNGHAVDWHGPVLPISASVGYVAYATTDTPAAILHRPDEARHTPKTERRDPGARPSPPPR